MLHEALVIFILLFGGETTTWREKERYRIKAVQMDNLRGLLGINRMSIRLMKVFSSSLAMWREWRKIGLLRASCKRMCC